MADDDEFGFGGVDEVAVNAKCDEIAVQAVETAKGLMMNMCGNAGQASIIDQIDLTPQIDDISQGSSSPIDSSHPEAVGIITQAGEEVLADAAAQCQKIRDAAKVL